MPCHVRSSSKLRHRRKVLPSLLRQMRLLESLTERGLLRIEASCAPGKPRGGSDGHGAQ